MLELGRQGYRLAWVTLLLRGFSAASELQKTTGKPANSVRKVHVSDLKSQRMSAASRTPHLDARAGAQGAVVSLTR